jgi:hypothetical protein
MVVVRVLGAVAVLEGGCGTGGGAMDCVGSGKYGIEYADPAGNS